MEARCAACGYPRSRHPNIAVGAHCDNFVLSDQWTVLTLRAMGPYALPWQVEHIGPEGSSSAATQYFNNRKLSIFGGSNEIQKNIISKMILGL